MSESDYGMFRSFGIDHGELQDMSPQQCFVLGYELAQIDGLLKHSPTSFSQPVHADNQERIRSSLAGERRNFTLIYMADDKSGTWMWLHVGPKIVS